MMKTILVIVTCVLVLLLLSFTIWQIPRWQVSHLHKSNTEHEVFLAENEARRTVIQLLGGLFFLSGLTFTYLQWLNTQQSLEAIQDRQITERHSKATEQLGSDKLDVRIGSIYSLERIARDSERDHWPIMEALTAFVRQRSPWKESDIPEEASEEPLWAREDFSPHIAADLQSALTVIGRREHTFETDDTQRLNLSGTDLRRVLLIKANFENALIANAHLEWARMSEAKLNGAYLALTHLENAFLTNAQLRKAVLVLTFLTGAKLEEADLREAVLGQAVMIGANLEGADLRGADLRDARLEGANLRGADFQGAKLSKAVLTEGATLEGAKNLTQAQINSAITDATTKIPSYLKQP